MPTITNPGVIEALVHAFIMNGRDKGKAGLTAGYSASYVKNGNCAKLWSRPDVLQELKRQELELIAKTGYTKEQAQYELEQARQLAFTLNQPSACVSAVTGKMRLHGMDQPDAKKDSTVIIINPPTQPRPVPSQATAEPCEAIDAELVVD